MTSGSILLGLALLLLVALFVAHPLLVGGADKSGRVPSRRTRPGRGVRARLLAEKEALLEEIRVLDFDYETGKLPDELYRSQRADRVTRAAAVLRQLDEQAISEDEVNPIAGEIERAVARLRQKSEAPSATITADVDDCPECGQPVASDDRFCAYCGQQLRQVT